MGALALLFAVPAAAQEGLLPRLDGRVFQGLDTTGLAGATVVLHRVTPDAAGEIDTTQASPRGSFSFDLPSTPDPLTNGEVYFASVDHQGILYFGEPVADSARLREPHLIQVYDTTVVVLDGIVLPVRGRTLLLEPGGEGWVLTDMFEVENPGQRTLVPTEGGFVWSYPLPPGAHAIEIGGGDAAPDAIALVNGRLEVSAPITPGVKQYLVRYQLAERRLDLPLPGFVSQVQLLVPEPGPALVVQGLAMGPPAPLDGITYRRYGATGIENATVRVLAGTESDPLPFEWVTVILGLMLAAATLVLLQVSPANDGYPMAPAAGVAHEERERSFLELALLDEALDGDVAEDRRLSLSRRRQALVRRLQGIGEPPE